MPLRPYLVRAAVAFLAVAVVRAADLRAGAFVAVLAAGAFLAAVFFAVAVVFLAAAVFAVVFLAVAVVFFAGAAFLAVAVVRFAVAFLAVVAFFAAAFLTVAAAPPPVRLPLGAFLTATSPPRGLLRAAHQVLEALARTEAGNRGLLDPNPLTRLRVAGVTGRTVDLLERTEARDRDPVSADGRADDGVQDRVNRLGGLLTATDLVRNGFYELRLVHVFPFGDIARTKVFKLFRTLGRYIPQIKHETG